MINHARINACRGRPVAVPAKAVGTSVQGCRRTPRYAAPALYAVLLYTVVRLLAV